MHEKLNAVICVLNSKYIHSSLAPWCLLAGVETYGGSKVGAQVVEGTINEKVEAVAQRIIERKPHAVGFCCYIWNVAQTKKLIQLVKEALPDCIVILGGPEISYNAEEVLEENPFVQYVISGEGERPFALLLHALQSGGNVYGIPGLCYREGGRMVVAEPNTPQNDPPSPYTEKYLHALKGRIAYLETSRGCPYSCAFCLSGRCGSARFFDLERAKRELLLLANSGTQTVKLVDRTFNANRKRAIELFRFVIQNYEKEIPEGVCFHFEIAGDILDNETIELLAAAPVGAIQLEIGMQSFNPKTLSAINRKTDVERLKKNIRRLTERANMHIHIDLIAGLPHEGWDSFAESFNTAYSLNSNMLQLGFLKLLHGAPMREEPEIYPCRFSCQPPYEVTDTPWLTEEELQRLHRMEDAVERLHNSGRFRRTLEYVLQQSEGEPFDLFDRFGEFTAGKDTAGISLDDYSALVFDYFSCQTGIDKAVLRDKMVCDRLATNSSGRLPPVLYRKDPVLRDVIRKWEQRADNQTQFKVRKSYAVLYSENCAVCAEYRNRNPITGEYPLSKINMA